MSNNVVTAEGIASLESEPLSVDRRVVWRGTLHTGAGNIHQVFFSGGAADTLGAAILRHGEKLWVRIQGRLVSYRSETYIVATYVLPSTTLPVEEYGKMLSAEGYQEIASVLLDGYVAPSPNQADAHLFSDPVTIATLLTGKEYDGGAHTVVMKGQLRRTFSEWVNLRRSGFHAVVQGRLVTGVDRRTRVLAAGLRPSGRFSTAEFR